MAKVKNKRNSGLADKVQSKKKGAVVKKKLNPFEVHINREKLKVLGQKSKHDRGLPGVSRSKAIQKRKETLGTELKLYNKTNTFIDRRIGEKDSQLSLEERNVARFAAERAKQHGKKSIYNLADDEVLTHRGQTLEQIEKFDDPRSSDEDEEDDGRRKFGGLDDEFVSEGHFGGGVLTKTTSKDGAKSHKDLIDQLIAESKKRKVEKQKLKEQTLDLTEKLDSEWKDLQPVVLKKARVEESVVDRLLDGGEKNAQDYDKMMRELRFEKRGTPSDALKSDEQTSKEERKKLEQLEKERLQRMLGEEEGGNTRPVYGNHRSAEDLDDNFDLEESHDYMLAYDNDGNPLLPDHILNDKYVPGSKKNFEDGISDSSDDENIEEESGDDDDDENGDDNEQSSTEGEDDDGNNDKDSKTDQVAEIKNKKKNHDEESGDDDDDDEQSSPDVKVDINESKTNKAEETIKNKPDNISSKINNLEGDSSESGDDDASNSKDKKTRKADKSSKKAKINIISQNDNDKSESDTDKESSDDITIYNTDKKTKTVTEKLSKQKRINVISKNDTDNSDCNSDIEISDIKQILQPDDSSDNDSDTEDGKFSNSVSQNKLKVTDPKATKKKNKLNNEKSLKETQIEENETKHKETIDAVSTNKELNGLDNHSSLNEINSEIEESDVESETKEGTKKFDNLDDLRNSDDSSDDNNDIRRNNEIESESDNDIDVGDKLKSFFDKSEEANNLKDLLSGKTPNQQSIALEKLIKTHDPSLGENNKESLSRLFAHLLQYINDLFTNLTQESEIIKSFLIFDKICPHLYDLAQTNKVSTKKFLADVLKEKHEDFKKQSKIVPDLDTLVFFKLVSLIYPTSDYRHPITTPAIVFMSEILTLSRFRDAFSISRGLFIVTLLLEYTVLSKRFVPSAINFLRGIFYLASNTSILNPIQVVPPFKLHKDVKILKLEDDCSKMAAQNKMAAKDFVLKEIDNDFKIRVLNTSVVVLKEFFDNYSDFEAQEFVFDSHIRLLSRIDVENYPKRVGEVISKSLNYMKQCLEVKTYTPLTREAKKPKMLRLYEPDVQEVFTGNRNNKQPREKIEQDKLKHKYKRAMKGALREIRRDKSYIASVKIKQKIQSDNIRKDKVKQIYKEASIQQGELNKLKRMK